jgi:hypothetical protein
MFVPTMPLVGADQQRRDVTLPQVHQELVQVDGEEALPRHRVEISVQAVDHDARGAVVLHLVADLVRELARRELRGIDLPDRDDARFVVSAQRNPDAVAASEERPDALVEEEHGGALAARGRGRNELRDERGLAGAGRSDDEGAGPALEPATQQSVEGREAARQPLLAMRVAMLGGDEAGKDVDAAPPDQVVVVPRRGTCARDA